MKSALFLARIFSTIFRPSYYPTVGTFILLSFTYLSLFPWTFKLWILALVYVFTFCLPALGIYIYRRLHGWSAMLLPLPHAHLRRHPHAALPHGHRRHLAAHPVHLHHHQHLVEGQHALGRRRRRHRRHHSIRGHL